MELNKTYTYECDASFGTLSQEKVDKLFKDGRRASGFLEIQLEEWFPDLTFEDGKVMIMLILMVNSMMPSALLKEDQSFVHQSIWVKTEN